MGKRGRKLHILLPLLAGMLVFMAFCLPASSRAADSGGIYGNIDYDAELDALFRDAMKKREAGNLEAAIEEFHTILSNQPLLHRARLELAVAYYRAYKFQAAIEEAKKVLDDPNTPPNVRVTILAFLAQVKQDEENLKVPKSYWKFPVMFGYIYNDNVNFGPDSHIFGGQIFDPGIEEESDSGLVASAGVDLTYQTGKHFMFNGRDTAFLWQSGANVYHRGYFDETDYNLAVITLRTGPTLISRGSWRANLTLQDDILYYGREFLGNYLYLLPAVTFNVTDALEVTLDGTFSDRDYHQSCYQGEDSFYVAGRLSAGYVTRGGRLALQGGAEIFNENADDDYFSNDGWNFFVGGNLSVAERCNLFVMFSREERKYDDPPPNFDDRRDEDDNRYTAGINYTFENMGVLSDWMIELKYIYNDYDSNLSAYAYERTQVLTTFSKTF
ncbi:MAG: hypothetical protein DRH04_01555 [Deltaproteobacteria bacterium]|nr:MAG: hypothetical protein DRH04_01555 [Deltaproteobacteria bacterium]